MVQFLAFKYCEKVMYNQEGLLKVKLMLRGGLRIFVYEIDNAPKSEEEEGDLVMHEDATKIRSVGQYKNLSSRKNVYGHEG